MNKIHETEKPYENWEPVIGLEIHAQLNTRSKLFGSEPYLFGHEPNTDIGVVCTAQPGSLPVLNQEAVKKAVQFGCAIQATIPLFSKFDRKSYFYPDTPKNFQITQLEHPIVVGGVITCEVEGSVKQFKVNRAHLEEDSGMLKHFSTFSGVDYNRAGIALIEIVSEPCLHSAKDAAAYAAAIRAIMEYLDASDCNMEEGSLRFDANVSVRPKGSQELRPKVEIKNMNSFSNMEAAIESEIKRQIQFYLTHPHEKIESATLRFDTETRTTVLMRTKEEAEDYRYFPEPDLPPLLLTQDYIDTIRSQLPELPYARFQRYITSLQLPVQPASILVNQKRLSDYFEEALKLCKNGKSLANWLTVEFSGRLKESGKALWDLPIPSSHIAELVNLIDSTTITGKIAKSVADEMIASPGKSPGEIVAANPDYKPVSDTASLDPMVLQVLAENPQSIVDFKEGKARAFDYLVGQVMKLCRGKATPAIVHELLKKHLEK